jgi:hypothetical protein
MARKKPKPKPEKPEKEDEDVVVLCFKVLMMPRPPVAGCSKVPCSACNQPVWISPATMAHMADKPHRICCAECVANEADDDMQVMPPSDGQIAEIVATDPSISAAKVRRTFPASNPAKRRAALEDILRRTKKRKRFDN